MGGNGRNGKEILSKTKEVSGKSKIRNPRREDSREEREEKRGLKTLSEEGRAAQKGFLLHSPLLPQVEVSV